MRQQAGDNLISKEGALLSLCLRNPQPPLLPSLLGADNLQAEYPLTNHFLSISQQSLAMLEKNTRKVGAPRSELFAKDFPFQCPIGPLVTCGPGRARVAPVTSRPVLRHLSCGRGWQLRRSQEGYGCHAGARQAWALVGPGRGCGGGGGDGRTADGLVESPRRLSPFIPEELARYRGRPGDGPLFGLARPRLICPWPGGTTSPGPTIAVSQVLAGPFRRFSCYEAGG